jgi:ribosomal protein S18 acetylase RimI-like enzyme
VALTVFGMPDSLTGLLAGFPGAPDYRGYAAWDGGKMVGVAGLLVHGDIGHLSTAGTLPEYRGRGVQSALIALRAREAAAAGCKWLVTETGAGPGTSLNNMLRAGFKPLYDPRNWRWRPTR